MTEARIPTPRRVAAAPVAAQPSDATGLGQAMRLAGQVGQDIALRDRRADRQVEEIDHRIALDEQRRQDDMLYIKKAAEFVELEAVARKRAIELRQDADFFADGHAERVREELQRAYRAFDESFDGNEAVRQRFHVNLWQSAARIDAEEENWQRQQQFKAQGEAFQNIVQTRRNMLSRADPSEVGSLHQAFTAEVLQVIAAGAYNKDQRLQLERAARTELSLGVTDSLFNGGKPNAVKELIDTGFFDRLDLDVDRLGDRVGQEQRALDLAATRAQGEAQRAAREMGKQVQAKIGLGINPTDAEFAQARQAMAQAGVPESELIGFDGLRVQMALNRQFSEAADPDGSNAARYVESLKDKIADGTANEVEQIAFEHLGGVAEARAKAIGKENRELVGQGVSGQMTFLSRIDNLSSEQRFAAAEEAQRGLGHVAQLRPSAREFALSGREIRKARPKDFGEKAEVKKAFDQKIGAVASSLGGSYDEILNLAWDLYVGGISSSGGDGWSDTRFMQSVDVAFGANLRGGVRYGGIGDYRGGKFIVPEYTTEDQFERWMRGLSFKAARYSDGSAADKDDVLSEYRPEYWKDTSDGQAIYVMVDAKGDQLGSNRPGVPYNFAVPRHVGTKP